jgi:hypothetical protein
MALITASPANFVRLLEIQKQSLEATQAIKTLLDSGPPAKREEESLKIQKAQFDIDKKSLKLSEDELKAQQTFLTIGEKLKGLIPSMPTGFGMKQGLLKSLNFGGVLNKTIAKNDFVKSQKDLGSTKSSSDLKDDFETRHSAKKDYDKADKTLQEFKKSNPGMTDEEIKKRAAPDSKIGMAVAQKMAAVKTISGLSKPNINTDAAEKSKSFDVDEQDVEAGKKADENAKVLKKIEENTSALAPPGKSGKPVAAAEGKGLFSGLAGGAGKALDGMKSFGIGLIAIAGALYIAAEAFKNFGDVDWDMIGKGMVALGGLVLVAIGLDKLKGSIIKGALVLGILALATWGIGEVFKGFADLDWETIGKGFTMIVGLGVIAAVMGLAAPLLFTGALALAAIGIALVPLAFALDLAKDGMVAFADTMERLSKVDAGNLALLGPALVSLGIGMAAFGVGQAAAGLGNLVSGLLSKVGGGMSPVDQIIALGTAGEGVNQAGSGMQRLADGMSKFSAVDPDKIKAIAALPLDKLAAMGAIMNQGNQVAAASGSNQGAAMAAQGGGSSNTVVAPTTNTTVNKQATVVALPVRNQDQTMSRYVRSRYQA